MKTRLALLVVFGLVAAYYFPDSRAAMLEAARPGLDHFYAWQTRSEMTDILRGLRTYEREHYGALPQGREWPRWLERNYIEGTDRDAWGTAYFLLARPDSMRVVSAGADRIRGTGDDLTASAPRLRRGR